MGLDPDPRPKSKGERRREQILKAIEVLERSGKIHITVQDIQNECGIRSFNTVTKQLLVLRDHNIIEWEPTSTITSLKVKV